MKRIRPNRVAHALNNVSHWREAVQSQASTHLMPLLALLEAGAGTQAEVVFNETPDEFAFWDKYFRLHDGDDEKPYFNPVLLRRAEKGFPHSNSATIRKNTFELKWKAATRSVENDGEHWSLSDDYADIFRQRVMTKKGHVTRIPVIDVACILLRDFEFPDEADAAFLEQAFRQRFPQSDESYEKLFSFVNESSDHIFQPEADLQAYEQAIESVLIKETVNAAAMPTPAAPPVSLPADDDVLVKVQQILSIGTSGIIFSGSPGTGKTYYARRVAQHLVKNVDTDIFRVQFHPSYGYEDFVEGYRPAEGTISGFKIVSKTFILACEQAKKTSDYVVVIVDEINRGDPARVFGELLTYLEQDYRGQPFHLPFSGSPFSIPSNLLLLGTMNPHDRSVSHVDAAFVRRFDHIEMSPSREVVQSLLEKSSSFAHDEIDLIGTWFDRAQSLVPFGLGHSFFSGVRDLDHLRLIWQYRILPTAVTASEVNEGRVDDLTRSFEALVARLEGQIGAA